MGNQCMFIQYVVHYIDQLVSFCLSYDCDDMQCQFGSHCVFTRPFHHGNCECAGNSLRVNIRCFQTNVNYLQ